MLAGAQQGEDGGGEGGAGEVAGSVAVVKLVWGPAGPEAVEAGGLDEAGLERGEVGAVGRGVAEEGVGGGEDDGGVGEVEGGIVVH